MINIDQMMAALAELMPDPARLLTDPHAEATIDAEAKRILAAVDMDPDAIFNIGNTIMMVSVQQKATPEDAVVGAFATGAALVATLFLKDLLVKP